MEKWLWFDMDGTLANLYGQAGWLKDLKAERTAPYRKALPMLDMTLLKDQWHTLREQGYHIGIISWTSKGGSAQYNHNVRTAKVRWLKKHGLYEEIDAVHVIKHGRDKAHFTHSNSRNAVLFDDDAKNRIAWSEANGLAFTEKSIFSIQEKIIMKEGSSYENQTA